MDMVSATNPDEEKKPTKKTAKKEQITTDGSVTKKMEENITSSCQEFIEILGKNVNKYWKIGIYWLTALRNLLSSPFDEKTIEILGTT